MFALLFVCYFPGFLFLGNTVYFVRTVFIYVKIMMLCNFDVCSTGHNRL